MSSDRLYQLSMAFIIDVHQNHQSQNSWQTHARTHACMHTCKILQVAPFRERSTNRPSSADNEQTMRLWKIAWLLVGCSGGVTGKFSNARLIDAVLDDSEFVLSNIRPLASSIDLKDSWYDALYSAGVVKLRWGRATGARQRAVIGCTRWLTLVRDTLRVRALRRRDVTEQYDE